jgi:hypothetical protein
MAQRFKSLQVAVFVIVVAVMVGGSYIHSRRQLADPDEPSEMADPTVVLRAAQLANPALSIENDASRRPYVWIRERSTGRELQMPTDELAGLKLRFVDCDLNAIPPRLLYPNRTDITCLELRNDKHALSAYHFHSKDDWPPMQAFFELNVEPESRLGVGSGRKDYMAARTLKVKWTHEFIVSYMLWPGWGFVGYREEKIPDGHS